MNARSVVIVGGGLAGMAAAESLSRVSPSLHVTLYESKRLTGGRAGSSIDSQSGQAVDYCQHVAMGCCTNLIDMLRHCGMERDWKRSERLTFLHPDYPPSRFAPGRFLPAPLHLLGALQSQRYLSAAQKREVRRGLWKLMRTPASSLVHTTAANWLAAAKQRSDTIKDFWDVILVSALGEQTDRVSMAVARKVLIDGFAAARGSSDLLIPTRPLAELFGQALPQSLHNRGVRIHTGEPVHSISPDAEVITRQGSLKADAVICALPWHQIAKPFACWPNAKQTQLPDLASISKIASSPISGVHLWFDRPITELEHAVLVGTTAQWVFRDPYHHAGSNGGGSNRTGRKSTDSQRTEATESVDDPAYYYQVVISASADLKSISKQTLIDQVLNDLRSVFPEAHRASLLRSRIVTDPQSVFSVQPSTEAVRPTSATAIPWLFLAGDWTQTLWPATMEGAVISGRRAAQGVLQWLNDGACAPNHDPGDLVCEGIPPGFLSRMLIRS